jgi:hypothetical protein
MAEEDDDKDLGVAERWARFRFSVVGGLLASPPKHGTLTSELMELVKKTWRHPTTSQDVSFGFSTIERWHIDARKSSNPMRALRRRTRKDRGSQPAMANEKLRDALIKQWNEHKGWTVQLHSDNLAVLVEANPEALGQMPSYSSVLRFLKRRGLTRIKVKGPPGSPGVMAAQQRLVEREVRSYEAPYVGGLCHTDFHTGTLQVLTAQGQWQVPKLFAMIDDRSRYVPHAQWYLPSETAENYAHGLEQGFLKAGLWRALMHDNGPAKAAEIRQGLGRLSMLPEPTLERSPYQNAKQENWFLKVKSRLMAMLEGVHPLTPALLNEATLAWLTMEYHREKHDETGEPPLTRFLNGPSVLRPCPSLEELRLAFTMRASRKQRRTDGTVLVENIRFEVPSRYRTLAQVWVRYARWDLSRVHLADDNDDILCRLYPLDKAENAEGKRRPLEPIAGTEPMDLPEPNPHPGMAPLLERMIAQVREQGLVPAYLPKDDLPVGTTKEKP